MIVLAVLENYKWVEGKVQGMINTAHSRKPCVDFKLKIYKDAGAVDQVLADVEQFGLPQPATITMELLERVLGDARVLCASSDGKTTIRDALRRAGFPPEAADKFFSECIVTPGRNSNLIAALSEGASHCDHLLYAWEGLRTLDAKTKKRFSGRCYEANSAAKVVEIFRKWILCL
jgi:hypothetical protein